MTEPETPLLNEPDIQNAISDLPQSSGTEDVSVLVSPGILGDDRIPLDTWQRLDPKYAILDRVQWWILTGVVVVLGSFGWLIHTWITWDQFGLLHLVLLGLIGGMATAGLYCGQHFPQKVMNTSSWCITESGIEIRKGIWWKHRIFVPYDRIQHTDVNQGPMARLFQLATLVINTGGTHQPSIPLEGLNHERAEQLRKQLTEWSRPATSTTRS